MLHVLLLILKIIGWILLGIVGLFLLLVLLILFCPVRYQTDVSYQGGKTLQAKAKVRYLILSVRIRYDQSRERDRLEQEIRLLWFRLGKKKAGTAGRDTSHLAEEEPDDTWDEPDDMDVSWDDGEKTDDTENAVKTVNDSEKQPDEELPPTVSEIPTIELPEPETDVEESSASPDDRFDLDEPDDLPEEEKKRSGRLRIVCHKAWKKLRKIWSFIRNHTPEKTASRIAEKIGKKTSSAKKKLRRLQKFWNLSCTAKTREYLKKYIPRTFRHILPRKVKGYVHYGMDEPYKTGQVTGYLSLLPFVYQKGLYMQPDFEQKILELDVKMKGRIQLGYLLRIIVNRNIWRTIKVAKKVINQ